jgi:hypothetical protein
MQRMFGWPNHGQDRRGKQRLGRPPCSRGQCVRELISDDKWGLVRRWNYDVPVLPGKHGCRSSTSSRERCCSSGRSRSRRVPGPSVTSSLRWLRCASCRGTSHVSPTESDRLELGDRCRMCPLVRFHVRKGPPPAGGQGASLVRAGWTGRATRRLRRAVPARAGNADKITFEASRVKPRPDDESHGTGPVAGTAGK